MLERDILKQITDYLTAERIFWLRMNSGAMFGKHKGRNWAVRFGEKGMADLLVLPRRKHFEVVWLECKNEKGQQSADQKAFMERVLNEGHQYYVVRSADDVRKYVSES